jgi:hypothetical protein
MYNFTELDIRGEILVLEKSALMDIKIEFTQQ